MSGFSGRWKLRNGKVAELKPSPNERVYGVVEDFTGLVAWDSNGRITGMVDWAWNEHAKAGGLDDGYDLMERIREGAGQ